MTCIMKNGCLQKDFVRNLSSHMRNLSSHHKVDRKGRTAVTSWIASVGVCIGVMALIVVMAVMNGFQMSFKDSIMEISSYHVRVSNVSSDRENEFLGFCSRNNALCTRGLWSAEKDFRLLRS